MRIVFIGCVETSYAALEHLLTLPEAEVVGVVTRAASPFNADFRSLAPLAEAAGIPCFLAQKNQQAEMAAWVRDRRPDVAYCFGWSYLLRDELLALPPLGIIGYHPAPLPLGRGRHPIIWALALGLRETASCYFFMDRGADTGDLLSRVPVPVYDTDDAATLYRRLLAVSREQITTFTAQLASGTYPRMPQDHDQATYWRKRGRADGQIDWRMSSRAIYNLVRALTRPYVGAHCVVAGEDVKVWRVARADGRYGRVDHIEPGRVLEAGLEGVAVRCGEGVLRLLDHELDPLPDVGTCL